MPDEATPGGLETLPQLNKYARDLALIYQSEKEKRKALELAHERLREAYEETINRLVIASEYRDRETGNHIVRIARYSAFMAQKLGRPGEEVEKIRLASPMHDVGKIGIPDAILLKPGKLTGEEFEIIKTHTLIGAKILGGSTSEVLQTASEIALTHHEKWNGRGYPGGFAGNDIPLGGRIVAVADVFDALISNRPYKEAFSVARAIEIIRSERGGHFDPELVDLFLDNLNGIVEIRDRESKLTHEKGPDASPS